MSAIISACGLYRYRLEREVQAEGLTFAYIGINPSTADASIDDATVRKWKGFTLANGGRRFIVANAFAYRATDVNDLRLSANPFGAENSRYIKEILNEADVIVPCWGCKSKLSKGTYMRMQLEAVKQLIFAHSEKTKTPIRIFGLTNSGDPKHPLMLPYSTKLIDWNAV